MNKCALCIIYCMTNWHNNKLLFNNLQYKRQRIIYCVNHYITVFNFKSQYWFIFAALSLLWQRKWFYSYVFFVLLALTFMFLTSSSTCPVNSEEIYIMCHLLNVWLPTFFLLFIYSINVKLFITFLILWLCMILNFKYWVLLSFHFYDRKS